MKKACIAMLLATLITPLSLNNAWAKKSLAPKAPVPVQVKITAENANYVTTIAICNTSSTVIPMGNVELDFNYTSPMPSNIWGNPWANWQLVSQTGTQVILKGGTPYTPALQPDPNCTNPLTVQFNAAPTIAIPTGPFVFKAEGGQTAGAGTLVIKTPTAPVANLSSPTISITGPEYSKQQIVAWANSLELKNLTPGAYTVTGSPVDNGINFYTSDPVSAQVSDQQTATVNLTYTAVASGTLAVKLVNPPTTSVSLSLLGKKYTLTKTITNNASFSLPADTYTLSSVVGGYTTAISPNPITIPTDKSVTITYTPSTAPAGGPYTTSGGNIVDKNNKPTTFKGISWFGFNTGNHVVHGLWQADFNTMLNQIKSLGFNAIRLPFSFDFILDPSIKPNGITTFCGGKPCNTTIPQDSALNTFQWMVKQFTDNGIYVLLDDHYEDDLYVNSQTQWIAGWKKIAQLFINNPLVGYDLYNEPDSHNLTWETNAGGTPWATGITSAASAIYAIDTKKLIFIEGVAQGALKSNWGDGFATDDAAVAQNISNPKNLFTALAKAPYVNQIVVSPHVYGPDGTNNQGPDHSDQTIAWADWSRLHGYLFNNFLNINNTSQSGFCVSGSCHIYPLAYGEFGGKFDPADPYYTKDVATLNNLGTFVNRLGTGKAAQPSWFYWSWNPNSGNTGGILKDDWATIDCNKVNYLKKYFALAPAAGICS